MDPGKKPPEMSMYLSLLKGTGIHRRTKDSWGLKIPTVGSDPSNLAAAFGRIREILVSANMARVSVAHIFAELRKPPFGVRDGLLPILLAVFASAHEQHVAFYDGGVFLPEMSGLDTMRVGKRPEVFEMQYCDVGGVRAELFSKLLDLIASPTTSETAARVARRSPTAVCVRCTTTAVYAQHATPSQDGDGCPRSSSQYRGAGRLGVPGIT